METQETLTRRIHADFPTIPEVVVAQWLAPAAARPGFGWPAPDDGTKEPWRTILAGRKLSWWASQIWFEDRIPFELEYMAHNTRFGVQQILENAAAGNDALAESRERLERIGAYFAGHGTWPVPPVAYPHSDGLALVDGHHRFAAMLLERARPDTKIAERHAVWLALPNRS